MLPVFVRNSKYAGNDAGDVSVGEREVQVRLLAWAERIRTSRWRFVHLTEIPAEIGVKADNLWVLSPAVDGCSTNRLLEVRILSAQPRRT
jgi:hypothetical protein